MKNKIKIIALIAILIVIILFLVIANNNKLKKINNTTDKYKVLTSFYPIYIMTLNITNGATNIEVGNMADTITGCIHDYTLSTSDLKKFENCNVFIENGAGLESFTDEITSKYPEVNIIDGADLINELIVKDDGEINSHIWLSINNYISEVNQIAEQLSTLNPENSEIYKKNAEDYIEKLFDLKQQFMKLDLKNKKAICLNESLEYLLRENNMDVTIVETDHEQSSISAKTVKDLIDKMNKENIKAIFIDKDDSTKNAEMLANETGAKIYVLNSEMNGPKDIDAYIKVMQENQKTLTQICQ